MADVDEAAAAECVAGLRADGLTARAVLLDVTDVARVREVVAGVDAETPLATVVANAGVALRRPLVDVEPAEYDRVMDVNVRGVFFVVQAAVRAMTPRGRRLRRDGLLDVGLHRLDGADDGLRHLQGRRPAPHAGSCPRGGRQRRAGERRRSWNRRDRPHAGPRLQRRAGSARARAGPARPAGTAPRRSRLQSSSCPRTRPRTSRAMSSSSTAAGSHETAVS